MKLVLTVDNNSAFVRSCTPSFRICVEGESPRNASVLHPTLTILTLSGQVVLKMENDDDVLSFMLTQKLSNETQYIAEVKAVVGGENLKASAKFTTPPTYIGGKWITADKGEFSAICNLRVLKKPIKRAVMYATALGVYYMRINGKIVGEDFLAPGYTDYSEYVYYQSYDITNMLTKVENRIIAYVGRGWYSGHVFLVRQFFGNIPLFRAEIKIEYEDGSTQTVATNSDWQCVANKPYIVADNLDGETYDKKSDMAIINGEKTISYTMAREATDISAETKYFGLSNVKLEPEQNYPIRVYQELKALSVNETNKRGTYLVDLGQNFGGVAKFKLRGRAGTSITIRYGEMINKDKYGNDCLYTENLRGAKATDVYIKATNNEEEYIPRLTFHGFRYIEVSGVTSLFPPDVVGLPFCSDCTRSGKIKTNVEDINKIYTNVLWGQRSNFISIPTDCPQRDERAGWTGDAEVFCSTACYNYDSEVFFSKYLKDVNTSCKYNPFHAPSDWAPTQKNGLASPFWGDVIVLIPYILYKRYGNLTEIRRNIKEMCAWVDSYTFFAHNNIPYVPHSYGDWLSVESSNKVVTDTMSYANCTRLVSFMADLIGEGDISLKYSELYKKIKKAFNKKFVKRDGRIVSDTQTVYALALDYNLADNEKTEAIFAKRLVNNIKERGNLLSTGFIGVSKLLPILTKYGYSDVAYDLLLQDKYPSWLYSIRNGATTIWERWNSYTIEKGFGDVGMNSFNHYSLGSVSQWMYESMLGIYSDDGYKTVQLRPVPDKRVSRVEGEYNSYRGKIKVEYTYKNNFMSYIVEIPAGMKGVFTINSKDVRCEKSLEKHTEGNVTKIYLGSGKYNLYAILSSVVTTKFKDIKNVSLFKKKQEENRVNFKYGSYYAGGIRRLKKLMTKKSEYKSIEHGMNI